MSATSRAVREALAHKWLNYPASTIEGWLSTLVAEVEAGERALAELQETLTAVEQEVALVYYHITDGAISKCNTSAQSVKSVADDCTTALVDREVAEAVAEVKAEAERAAEAMQERCAKLIDDAAAPYLAISEEDLTEGDDETESLLCRLAAAIRALPSAPEVKTCKWQQDEDGNWHAGCEPRYILKAEGDPVENEMHYCPNCGAPVVESPYAEPDEPDGRPLQVRDHETPEVK